MNYWKTGIIPYSWAPKDTITQWSGMDHLDNYNKNPQKSDWENIDITYHYNPQGFRTHDLTKFVGKKVNVALGCSFTEGVGLLAETTWPSLIEQQTEYPMLNLGIGAGATDSIARILTNISGLFDIQTVYILWPPLYRFEMYLLYDKDHKLITNRIYKNGQWVDPPKKIYEIEPIYPMDSSPEHMWALTDEMNEQRFYRNQMTTELLANRFNYSIHQMTNSEVATIRSIEFDSLDFARDGSHWGTGTQRAISQKMLDM